MTRPTIVPRAMVLALLTLLTVPHRAAGIGADFTYQGQLEQNGSLATGRCDFRFLLFDTIGSGVPPTGGTQIGTTVAADNVQVSDGLFTLRLDFGAAAFSTGDDRFLQVAVRCPAGSGAYQTLTSRQPLTAAPYALFATAVADGAVSSAKLAPGAVTTSQLAPNAVTAAQIADGTVASGDLANGAVGTAKIGDGAVTTAKIGDGQVTAAKIVAPLRLTSAAANTNIGALDGTSTGSNGVGVSGTAGVGANAAGVLGSANAGDGVRGTSSNGIGVVGEGADAGVQGTSNQDGVLGTSTGFGDGVAGVAMDGAGVRGLSLDGIGVLGDGKEFGVKGTSANGDGVMGTSSGGSGVHGVQTGNAMLAGVKGESAAGLGVSGEGFWGVVGSGSARGVYGSVIARTNASGVYGESLNSATSTGVRGFADQGVAVRGETTSGAAGLFIGPVNVSGVLTASVKLFKIDHPLDPANKYLMHAAIESPELKNLYDGVVVLDANGEADVDLPAWFEALNGDFRYQLTCIGGIAPVYIAEEVSEGRFRIAGGAPGLKVSWQVTGVRKDAFAVAHPLVVESEKTDDERGRYLNPAEQGAPASRSVHRSTGAANQ